MNKIKELMLKANELKIKADKVKQELKQQKIAITREFTAGMSEETIKQQIAECENILTEAKTEYIRELWVFKDKVKAIKEKRVYAKELLNFVGYKISNGLPKVSVQRDIDGNGLVSIKENDIVVTLETNNENWKREWNGQLVKSLESKGLDNGEARNIAYKTKLFIESEYQKRNTKSK